MFISIVFQLRWDYRTSETPWYFFNVSTFFIDFAAWIGKKFLPWTLRDYSQQKFVLGLATDLKTVPKEMLKNRVLRTGDGSHKLSKQKDIEAPADNNNTGERDTEHFWGWGKEVFSFVSLLVSNAFSFPAGDKSMTEDDLKNVEILHKQFD